MGPLRLLRTSRMARVWTWIVAIYVAAGIPLFLVVLGASPLSDGGLSLIALNLGTGALAWLSICGWLLATRALFDRKRAG